MTKNSPALEAYQAALAALANERPRDVDDSNDLNAAIGILFKICQRRIGAALVPTTDAGGNFVQSNSKVDDELPDYDGMSVSEAAVDFLRQRGKPATATEIIAGLKNAGFEMNAEKPAIALAVALKRRSGNYNDIARLGRGVWTLTEFYKNEKELKTAQHKERTRAGMEAARTRGVKIGPKPKLNEQQAIQLKRMLSDGLSGRAIGEVFGITATAVYNYKKRLADWEPGQDYPPRKKKKSVRPDLKVVGE